MLTVAKKCSYCVGLLGKINTEHKRFGLPTMPELDNTRGVRIIIAMLSQDFISSFNSHNKSKKI